MSYFSKAGVPQGYVLDFFCLHNDNLSALSVLCLTTHFTDNTVTSQLEKDDEELIWQLNSAFSNIHYWLWANFGLIFFFWRGGGVHYPLNLGSPIFSTAYISCEQMGLKNTTVIFLLITHSFTLVFLELLKKLIKQFVVTNCSKERPGSIVSESPKLEF